MRHQRFHLAQLCSSPVVPVREVGPLRDLHVQQEVTLRADSPRVMFVCSAGHPGCPGAAKGEQVHAASGCFVDTSSGSHVQVVRGVTVWAPVSVLVCSPRL